MKKILVIHNTYREKGGEDIVVENEIKILKQKYIVKELVFDNNISNKFLQAFYFLINLNLESKKILKETLKNFKPDLVYVHNTWFKASNVIFQVLKKNNINTLIKLHNFRYNCTKSYLIKNHIKRNNFCQACSIERDNFKIFNKYYENSYFKSFLVCRFGVKYFSYLKNSNFNITVLTEHHKRFLQELGFNIKKVNISPNFLQIINTNPEKKNEEYLVYAGRISKEKGVKELIEAFLSCRFKNIKLKIIGIGPEYAGLKMQYHSNNIEFLGSVPNVETLEYIKNAKCVVTCTKLYEGQPTLLCEASLVKTPSIFPSFGGMPEFFPSDYILKYKQFDYGDLKSKLLSLLDYDLIKIGENNYNFIKNKITLNEYYSKIDSLVN